MLLIPETAQSGFVFAVMAIAMVLMASNRVRYDFLALLVVLALMLSGVLTVGEALAGFGNPVVILIGALLVVGEMLDRTGVARAVGDWILKHGGQRESYLLILIMLSSAVLSAVMSSTAVVAIFIPILLRIARQSQVNRSRLLLPMSYAALASGMLTLIATPPNLVISGELEASGYQPLGFFSFSLIGVLVLLLAIAYMLLLGRHWLPRTSTDTHHPYGRSLQALWQDFSVRRQTLTLRIPAHSPLCGRRLSECSMNSSYRIRVLDVLRPRRGGLEHYPGPAADFVLRADDILLVLGEEEQILHCIGELGLYRHKLGAREQQQVQWELGAITVLIHPNSRLIGRSVRDSQFRDTYGLDVFGLRRNQEAVDDYDEVPLAASDSLLVAGPWYRLRALSQQNHDFVVLESPQEAEEVVPARRHMPLALALTGAMVVVSMLNWLPLVAAALLAALGGVVGRCLTAQEAYRAIHWSSLILLAGMLPLAAALQKTGATDLIIATLLQVSGGSHPLLVLTILFFATVLLTNILSNTTAAILMAPIAIGAAEALNLSPYPMAIGLLMAASSAFLTPVASPVVTLVVEPGNYRFMDFVRLGIIPVLIVFAVAVLVVPLLFPW
ncbi:SLC13 family permease [Pseudomaricurvus sp. HS19]|uniref:SLC13 family permease n=1 Tax=Pseudomaricurvus sp. HS19 TaxID=2692626 RepID=UPI00136DE2DE|nr:SLC13 family permease [Pseudomaricurvus sp. HS19]MYM63036.1 TRAP transporter large permease subunit [Pseudomaricurvus sp. HS19]